MPPKKKLQKAKETHNEIFQDIVQEQPKKSQMMINNVEDIKHIEQHETLLPSNEPQIDMLNHYWKKVNKHIEEYTNFNEKTYLVDTNLFLMTADQLKNYKHEKTEESYKVYKFYKLSDDKGTQSDMTTTLNTVYGCFCADLLKNLEGNSDNSKFNCFKKAGSKNIYVTIYKIIRTKLTKGIKEELETIKDELNKKNGFVTQPKNILKKDDKNIETLIKKVKVMIGELAIPTRKFYIQKIYDVANQNKFFIYGSHIKLKQTDLKQFVENECLENLGTNLKIEQLKEIDIQLEVEGQLYTDEQIMLYNTINDGYNRYYNVLENDDINKAIFMNVQYELLYNRYSNVNVGSLGYIAMLEIENMKYVYSSFATNIVTELKYFYSMTNHNSNENKKMIDLLSKVNANNIRIEILKRNIENENLQNELICMLNKFAKENIFNYEECVYVNQKEFKKEISDVKSLVFLSKYKK